MNQIQRSMGTLVLSLVFLSMLSSCQRNLVQAPAGQALTATAASTKTKLAASPAATNIAIFTGGDPSSTSTLYTDIKTGVWTTVVLWDGHVSTTGDINFNDTNIVRSGAWVSNTQTEAWLSQVTSLKTGTTDVTRLEFSFGGEATTFANIKTLINTYGTDSASPLYKSFKVLHTKLGVDAIDFDDESTYDATSSKAFALMCAAIGMKVSICPYTNSSYWKSLVTSINASRSGLVDAIYLQCYDGGAGNSPSSWNSTFSSTGLKVVPGMWAIHNSTCNAGSTSAQVETQFAAWAATTTLAGGFMYNGNEMEGCPLGGTPAQYSEAIATGL